jgi:hypothetical protein
MLEGQDGQKEHHHAQNAQVGGYYFLFHGDKST